MGAGDTNVWIGTTNAYATAGNWSLGTAPATGEHIVIPAESSQTIAASDQSATAIRSFTIEDGYDQNIGDADSFLQLSVTSSATVVDLAPTGTIVSLDLSATAVPVTIRNSGQPAAGEHAIQLKGTALTTINVFKGIVGIGVDPGDATTDVDDIFVSYKTEQGRVADAQVTIGAGVTGESAPAFASIRQSGGKIWNYSTQAVTILDVADGEYHQMAGTWATARFFGASKVFPRGTGTNATTTLWGTSKVNHLDLQARTYTTLILHSGTTWWDKQFRNTYSSPIQLPDGLHSVNMDLGADIDMAITAI